LDFPFAEATGAGRIFGATGGVMEAAIRTAYKLLVGSDLAGDPKIADARGLERVKIFSVEVGGVPLNFAVANGLGEVRALIEPVLCGSSNLHFIEVMTCPGGCIGGGGQPYHTDLEALKKRMRKIYEGDRKAKRRLSHENEQVQMIYKKYLGKPLSPISHRLLHRSYRNRKQENRRFEGTTGEMALGEFQV
jgi:iron only hydrogenase large subunit-like protein